MRLIIWFSFQSCDIDVIIQWYTDLIFANGIRFVVGISILSLISTHQPANGHCIFTDFCPLACPDPCTLSIRVTGREGLIVVLYYSIFDWETEKITNQHDCKWPLISIACAKFSNFLLASPLFATPSSTLWFLIFLFYQLFCSHGKFLVFVDLILNHEISAITRKAFLIWEKKRELLRGLQLFTSSCSSFLLLGPLMSGIVWDRGRATSHLLLSHNDGPKQKPMIICHNYQLQIYLNFSLRHHPCCNHVEGILGHPCPQKVAQSSSRARQIHLFR